MLLQFLNLDSDDNGIRATLVLSFENNNKSTLVIKVKP